MKEPTLLRNFWAEVRYYYSVVKAWIFGTPQVSEYTFKVVSKQPINGGRDLLIGDHLGRSIMLSIGAVICSMKLPKDGWQDIYAKITPGAQVTVKVLAKNIEEFQNNQIPAINAVSLVRIL